MLAVTGSTWGPEDLRRVAEDPVTQTMSRSDFLVILGDSGVFRPRADLRANLGPYRDLPCSVLFLDGSRDDYDVADGHPPFPWNGGKTQSVCRGVTRLMRGQVFSLCGLSVLTLGGAPTPGRSDEGKYWDWWPEQDPARADAEEAVRNASRAGGSVDVVLTCDCPRAWKRRVSAYDEGALLPSAASDVLQSVLDSVGYGRWYFGNYDADADFPDLRASLVRRRVLPVAGS